MAPLLDVPPLHAAVWAGDLSRVHAILQAAVASSNSNSSASEAGLQEEAEGDGDGNRSALERVLEAKDARGNSALHLAVRLVQPAQRAIVQLLLVRASCVRYVSCDLRRKRI